MEPKLCPRCKEFPLDPVDAMNAVSRRDNKTLICPDCGVSEALNDWLKSDEDLGWLKEVENEGYI